MPAWQHWPRLRRGADMRWALWLLGLFGVAVAMALGLGVQWGTVTVFVPPHRIDLSLNLALLLLAAPAARADIYSFIDDDGVPVTA